MRKDKLQFPTIETELAFFIGLMLASMWQSNGDAAYFAAKQAAHNANLILYSDID